MIVQNLWTDYIKKLYILVQISYTIECQTSNTKSPHSKQLSAYCYICMT